MPQTRASARRSSGVGSLPDELLIAIFGFLTLKERCASAARVCRRWWLLASSEPLLQDVEVTAPCSFIDLCWWLHKLSLRGSLPGGQHLILGGMISYDSEARRCIHALAKVFSKLAAMPAAAAAQVSSGQSGGLTDISLTVHMDTPLDEISGCIVPVLMPPRIEKLRSLQRLRVHAVRTCSESDAVRLQLVYPLCELTALRELSLEGTDGLGLVGASQGPALRRLPSSLTKLHLGCQLDEEVLAQVSPLTNLRSLSLDGSSMAAHPRSLGAALSRLTCLEQLALSSTPLPPPAVLQKLAAITALRLHKSAAGRPAEVHSQLEATLAALPQLVQLVCSGSGERATSSRIPAAVSCLPRLERLGWEQAVQDASLPGGNWLCRLRQLAVPAATLTASLAHIELAVAEQLSSLGIHGISAKRNPQLIDALSSVAGKESALRRLCLAVSATDSPSWSRLASIAVFIHSRPGVEVQLRRSLLDELDSLHSY